MSESSRGRKPSYKELVAVDVDGLLLICCDGEFFGDPALAADAFVAVSANRVTQVYGRDQVCGTTGMSAVATLLSVSGRARLVHAPLEIKSILAEWSLYV